MSTDLATTNGAVSASTMETVLLGGDLAGLSNTQRLQIYTATCESLGLNPLTKPFDYLKLNGKLVLYANKDCAAQLRNSRGVSIVKLERERIDDLYLVTATAKTTDGREDSAIGAVPIGGMKGEALANAFMKAETKAKRRVTLSICGLGMLDESEVRSIQGAVIVDANTFDEQAALPKPSETPAEKAQAAWFKLQKQGAQYHVDVKDINPDASEAEIREAFAYYRDEITQAKEVVDLAS